jgi:hypothetical protein
MFLNMVNTVNHTYNLRQTSFSATVIEDADELFMNIFEILLFFALPDDLIYLSAYVASKSNLANLFYTSTINVYLPAVASVHTSQNPFHLDFGDYFVAPNDGLLYINLPYTLVISITMPTAQQEPVLIEDLKDSTYGTQFVYKQMTYQWKCDIKIHNSYRSPADNRVYAL